MGAGLVGTVNEAGKRLGLFRRKLVQFRKPAAYIGSLHVVGFAFIRDMPPFFLQKTRFPVIPQAEKREENPA